MSLPIASRRFAILAILTLQIFSSVPSLSFLPDIGLNLFRVLLILCAGWIFLSGNSARRNPGTQPAVVAGFALLIWMMVSLAWSYDIPSGLRNVAYLATFILLLFTLSSLVSDKSDLRFLAIVISIEGIIVLLLSYYELNTGIHFFRSSIQETAELDQTLGYIVEGLAWFTFDNPNDLAVHLIFSSLFLVPLVSRRPLWLPFLFIYFAFLVAIVDRLGARLALGGVFLFLFVYGWARLTSDRRILVPFIVALSLAAVLLIAVSIWWADELEMLDVSTFIRLKLLESGILMAAGSFFVGVGAGSFESEMWANGYVGMTYGMIDPHNAFGRLLAENGVIGLLLFIYLLAGPLLKALRAPFLDRFHCFVLAATPCLALLFSAGSDPISSSTLQLALAVIWVAVNLETGPTDSRNLASVHAGHRKESFAEIGSDR